MHENTEVRPYTYFFLFSALMFRLIKCCIELPLDIRGTRPLCGQEAVLISLVYMPTTVPIGRIQRAAYMNLLIIDFPDTVFLMLVCSF